MPFGSGTEQTYCWWVWPATTIRCPTPASASARTLTYFTVFLVMVALLHAAHYYRAERAREVREAGLARGLAEARLAALRTQLQPHFVFNVLNAVTALLHADPMAADRMLTRFAALLRVILHEGTEEHALERGLREALDEAGFPKVRIRSAPISTNSLCRTARTTATTGCRNGTGTSPSGARSTSITAFPPPRKPV